MNSELTFQISAAAFQHESNWNPNRFFYTATTSTGDDVVVKFTRRYCPELHSFCADRDHAPRLLGYGTVPGGWKVVVMELIKIENDIKTRSNNVTKYWTQWNDDLTKLVKDFHDKGWVHGDLRAANVIVPAEKPDKIMLLDFDWGGECGKVSYPTWRLNEVLIDKTVKNRRITKDHDVRVLTATLKKLSGRQTAGAETQPPLRCTGSVTTRSDSDSSHSNSDSSHSDSRPMTGL